MSAPVSKVKLRVKTDFVGSFDKKEGWNFYVIPTYEKLDDSSEVVDDKQACDSRDQLSNDNDDDEDGQLCDDQTQPPDNDEDELLLLDEKISGYHFHQPKGVKEKLQFFVDDVIRINDCWGDHTFVLAYPFTTKAGYDNLFSHAKAEEVREAAKRLYTVLGDDTIKFLNDNAVLKNQDEINDVISGVIGLDCFYKLLNVWRTKYVRRRLRLLGCTSAELDSFQLMRYFVDYNTLYVNLLSKPLSIHFISTDVCKVLAEENCRLTPDERKCLQDLKGYNDNCNKHGNTSTVIDKLSSTIIRLLTDDGETFRMNFDCLILHQYLYLRHQLNAETVIAQKLLDFQTPTNYHVKFYRSVTAFNRKQQQAISLAVNNTFSIITGGPGTGKSTVSTCIVANWIQLWSPSTDKMTVNKGWSTFNSVRRSSDNRIASNHHWKQASHNKFQDRRLSEPITILILAYTGKAVNVIMEAVYTYLQKLHIYNIDDDNGKFTVTKFGTDINVARVFFRTTHAALLSPIKPTMILIDEISLLPAWLLARLLMKYRDDSSDVVSMTFVGDPYQLPSIDAGDVARELSKVLPTVELVYNWRCDSSEGQLAKNIDTMIKKRDSKKLYSHLKWGDNKNINYNYNEITGDDMFFVAGNRDTVLDTVKRFIDSGALQTEVCVIDPFNGEPTKENCYKISEDGCLSLNWSLRGLWNSKRVKNVDSVTDRWDKEWWTGDLVLVIKNLPDRGLRNGSVGEVLRIETDKCRLSWLVCKFGSQEVGIPTTPYSDDSNTDEFTTQSLRLAWCRTTHRVQGDEFKVVIYYIPYNGSYHTADLRNVFTAISRAKCVCICVAPREDILRDAVNFSHDPRIDNLLLTYNYYKN